MKGVLHTLVAASQVSPSISDKEFREFLDVAAACPAFAYFEPKFDHLDVLLHENIAPQSG